MKRFARAFHIFRISLTSLAFLVAMSAPARAISYVATENAFVTPLCVLAVAALMGIGARKK